MFSRFYNTRFCSQRIKDTTEKMSGLFFEQKTDLTTNKENLHVSNKTLYNISGVQFTKHFSLDKKDMPIGCRIFDESYIDPYTRTVFIIEKKYRGKNGSTDQIIQTGLYKKNYIQSVLPGYHIHYMYCLSNWFRGPNYKTDMEYMYMQNIPVFWGDTKTYKKNMVCHISSILEENTKNLWKTEEF